jgi:hypothetical protein
MSKFGAAFGATLYWPQMNANERESTLPHLRSFAFIFGLTSICTRQQRKSAHARST